MSYSDNSLEERLRQEETDILQHKYRTNSLVPEASLIVEKILRERNAEVPLVETEEEAEEKYRINGKVSLILFLLTMSYVLALYFGNVTFLRFCIFTFAFIMAFRYTLSLKIK